MPKADTKNYTKQDDLKGEVVGAQVGTAFVDALKKSGLFSEVKAYDTILDILRDVNAGRSRPASPIIPILAYNLSRAASPRRASSRATSRPSSARSASACARATPSC